MTSELSLSIQSHRNNLFLAEYRALKSLVRNKDLVISKAGKGDPTVVMDATLVMNASHYLELAYKYLGDESTYQVLSANSTSELAERFNSHVDNCLRKKIIMNIQGKILRLPADIDTQAIYFLPKIHKDPMKLHPIVSCTNGPTYTASAFVNSFLQPHMHRVRSYIKNSMDLIHLLEILYVPANAHLVTLDIESLYTNISHEQTITSVLKRLENHPKKILILDLLKYVLKNHLFKFNEHILTQLHGIVMGTNWPQPSLAYT